MKTHSIDDPNKSLHDSELSRKRQTINYKSSGYSKCSCDAPTKPGIVLDPFFGRGTTGKVANKQDKDFVGIELNPEYIILAKKYLNLSKKLKDFI